MYSLKTKVRYSETNDRFYVTLPSLVRYFQDVSISESMEGTADLERLREQRLAWVLGSWQIVIDRLPKINETITVGTVPYDFKGFIGYRNFWVEDEAGVCIVKAASIWTLIDIDAAKPVRPSAELLAAYPLGEKLEMNYAPRKIAVEGNGEKGDEHIVYKAQIDSNYHLNNSEYISIAGACLPENCSVKEMRAEYKRPAHLKDKITPVIYSQEGKMQVQLNDTQMNPYAIVEFTYE